MSSGKVSLKKRRIAMLTVAVGALFVGSVALAAGCNFLMTSGILDPNCPRQRGEIEDVLSAEGTALLADHGSTGVSSNVGSVCQGSSYHAYSLARIETQNYTEEVDRLQGVLERDGWTFSGVKGADDLIANNTTLCFEKVIETGDLATALVWPDPRSDDKEVVVLELDVQFDEGDQGCHVDGESQRE
ncbi:MAG: hypothetical protein U5R31_16805 [Acidimicrobiia bacterium]|nr:hypothetical protein [Acidimicrobiia bacterium]